METNEPVPHGGRACLHCGVCIPDETHKARVYCTPRCCKDAHKLRIDYVGRQRQRRLEYPDEEKQIRHRLKAEKAAKTGRGIRSQKMRMLSAARHRAERDGLPFNLTIEDLHIPDVCPALGVELLLGGGMSERDQAPSLDKILPALGYTKGNIVIVSVRANRAKNDLAIHELQALASFYTNLVSSGGWMVPPPTPSHYRKDTL